MNFKQNSSIERKIMMKSKIFQLFLKYSFPRAVILTKTSNVNINKNT